MFFDRKGVFYENLQALLASALKNEIQIQELKEAEEKFSDIAFSTSDWLWEVDANCRYTFCSDGVANVLGYEASEMIGRSLFDFVLPSETKYLEQMRDFLLPNMLPLVNLEHINIHKDGHQVDLVISGKPIIKKGQLLGYRGAFKDTTEVKAQENRIRQLAYNDTLTGLPNRTLFNDRLQMIMAHAQRKPHEFALLFLDLDHFKHINDTLGHDAGDMLLQVVAKRLSFCIRETDTLARLGGDEFTIIMSHIDRADDAVLIAKRIVKELNTPIEIRGHKLFITTSIGIAIYPIDGKTSPELLKNADKAMYKAKESGKNRFVFYDSQMDNQSNKRMQLEAILHKAMQDQAFELYYQPQVDAKTGHIVGTEALLRLLKTEIGPIPPGEFISLAEEIGLIEHIGLWVFETACTQAREWEKMGHPIRVAINVSARQLRNNYLAETFIEITRRLGLAAHLVEIEITENAVIENEANARKLLDAFSAEGYKIAIDDFGTGYSSLSSLKKFPIDTVKIDRSFIMDCVTHSDSANIVRAIVHMAHSLGLNTIAEGVETVEQLTLLQEIGCKEIQGYLFSRPVPVCELDAIKENAHLPGTPSN